MPSPWTDHEGKQLSEYHSSKCEYTKDHLNTSQKIINSEWKTAYSEVSVYALW